MTRKVRVRVLLWFNNNCAVPWARMNLKKGGGDHAKFACSTVTVAYAEKISKHHAVKYLSNLKNVFQSSDLAEILLCPRSLGNSPTFDL